MDAAATFLRVARELRAGRNEPSAAQDILRFGEKSGEGQEKATVAAQS
jgi:hypothetical protein